MDYTIQDVEGIGPVYAEKLAKAGIKKTSDFLTLCCDKKGRKGIAASCDVSESLLLKWANLADLMRIKGIGTQYAELLEAAGVDTVKELKTRRADNLTVKMQEVNQQKKLARATPSEKLVAEWIEAAKTTEPLITH